MKLTSSMEKFILHWGEMGQKWGINRSVAQTHALLYLAAAPLTAEEVSETLSIARSNVSTSIKELLGWGIIRRISVMGDRREHFESLADVWEMFQIVMDERKRREIDPTMVVLNECLKEIKTEKEAPDHVADRYRAMLDFFEIMSSWYQQMRALPQGAVVKFMKMGHKLRALVSG